jgi:hypothetical protein
VYLQTCKRHWPWDLPPIPGVIFAATSMQIPFMNACGINLKCDYVIANFTIVSQITSLHKLPFCVKNSRTFSKFSRSRNWIFLHWLSQWLSSVCVCVITTLHLYQSKIWDEARLSTGAHNNHWLHSFGYD